MSTKNKIKLILTGAITLLPLCVTLSLWAPLTEAMGGSYHFAGTLGGLWVVALLPVFLLILHLFCIGITLWESKRKGQEQSPKVLNLLFWITPILSLAIHGTMYAFFFEYDVNLQMFLCLFLGILFVAMGNYFPKCTQNSFIGIRISYTLANRENWQKTHRLGGILITVCGALLCVLAFLPLKIALVCGIALSLISFLVPALYSRTYFYKQVKQGTASPAELKDFQKKNKVSKKVSLILVPVILAGCALLMFTGNVQVTLGESSMTVSATYAEDFSVDYAKIDRMEYREKAPEGVRLFGFGSFRLSLGSYRNDEIGNHTQYCYARVQSHILIESDGDILLLNLGTEEETKDLFETLKTRVQEARQ